MAQKLTLRAWQHAYPDSHAGSQRRREPVLHLCMMLSANCSAFVRLDIIFSSEREWVTQRDLVIHRSRQLASGELAQEKGRPEGEGCSGHSKVIQDAHPTIPPAAPPAPATHTHTHTHTHTQRNFPTRSQSESLLTSREEVVVSASLRHL